MLPAMVTAPTKRLVAAATAVSIVVIALLVWWLWPSRKPAADQPLARQYREFTVCLLTDERGVRGPIAQRQCATVFAAGATPIEAVHAKAPIFPHTRFYVVNPRTPVANVSAVDATDLRGSAYRLVTAAAVAASRQR